MIIVLSNDINDKEIVALLKEFKFVERGSESNFLTHHFIIIDEENYTYRISNSNRKRGEVINSITDNGWKSGLMEELLNPKKQTPLYPFRPKGGLKSKLEKLRESKDWSKSATVSYVVSCYFELNPNEIRDKDNS